MPVSFRILDGYTAGFRTGPHDPALPLVIDPSLTWNAFAGSAGTDSAECIAVDGSGNVYIGGKSTAAWGPDTANFNAGGTNIFAAKYNNSGLLQWNKFLGSGAGTDDICNAITLDSAGNVYLGGTSRDWGTPVVGRAHAGGLDAFVAKLDNSGTLQWHAFLGSADTDKCTGIAPDTSGNVYVSGHSYDTWGGGWW